MKQLLYILLCLSSLSIGAQNVTLSGTVKDTTTGEDLIGATVSLAAAAGAGTVTNIDGFYSLGAPAGQVEVQVSYLGYATTTRSFLLRRDTTLNFELGPAGETLTEVVVTATDEERNLTDNRGSVTSISVSDIESVPVLLGERDVMKVLQLTPGIKSAGEGNSGFYVRGGGLDQNLILLDEAPVYNPSHLLGFFSVFNSDALKNVTVYKGGIPAEYGGRASS
ncbi:MAG: TonB-dependent receptor, partial [Bacteroidota bacterium]